MNFGISARKLKYYVTDRDRSFWFEDVIFPKDPNILITTYFLSRETKCVYELMLFFIILGYVQNAELSEAHSDAPASNIWVRSRLQQQHFRAISM